MKKGAFILSALFSGAILLPVFGRGAVWTAKKLTNTTGDSFNPAVAVSGSRVYLAWDDDTVTNDHPEIYFMASSDGGATWKAARRLTQTAGVSRRPAVAAEGSKVYIVWEEETARDFDVYFKKSEDGGTTWQSAKRIVTSTLNDANPRIAVKGSNLYVVIQG